MRKALDNRVGITLIALIITIIILLILAGISISLIAGDNGILTRSTEAKGKTNKVSIQEEVEMAYTVVISKYYENYTNLNKTEFVYDNLQEEVEKTGIVTDYRKEDGFIKFYYESNEVKNTGYDVSIDEKGSVMIGTSTLANTESEEIDTSIFPREDGKNSNYLIDNTTDAICTLGSRIYYKKNQDLALAAVIYSGSYRCALLVSKTEEGAIYRTSNSGNGGCMSFEYNGETWYCSNGEYAIRPSFDGSYVQTTFPIFEKNSSQAAIDLLDLYFSDTQ